MGRRGGVEGEGVGEGEERGGGGGRLQEGTRRTALGTVSQAAGAARLEFAPALTSPDFSPSCPLRTSQ